MGVVWGVVALLRVVVLLLLLMKRMEGDGAL
jgi:hypothetical protein